MEDFIRKSKIEQFIDSIHVKGEYYIKYNPKSALISVLKKDHTIDHIFRKKISSTQFYFPHYSQKEFDIYQFSPMVGIEKYLIVIKNNLYPSEEISDKLKLYRLYSFQNRYLYYYSTELDNKVNYEKYILYKATQNKISLSEDIVKEIKDNEQKYENKYGKQLKLSLN